MSSPPDPVTLDTCASEPIHTPGAIQPHGVLVACAGDELRIVCVSENAAEVAGGSADGLLGRALSALLDDATVATIRDHRGARSWRRLNPLRARVGERPVDAIVHAVGDLLVVEVEPLDADGRGSIGDYATDLHAALSMLQGCESIADLARTAAEQIRAMTGFDRVMVYRFHPDDHGEVVAEDRRADLEPFLGLHYPASDIPAQARRLYQINWLRIIPDIGYRPAALRAAPEATPLDLSHAVLRSVSPIHVEYLRNMGVAASMSVSLVQGDRLWGLIACHHYSPRLLPYVVRMASELIGQTLSTLILAREAADAAGERGRIAELSAGFRDHLAAHASVAEAFAAGGGALAGELIGADGVALLERGRVTSFGRCPPDATIAALVRWMASERIEVLASDGLALEAPSAPALGDDHVGVLAFGFPIAEDSALAWFRTPQARSVAWAGDPKKVYREGPNGPRLSPRGSFALWRETVSGRSAPWGSLERHAAGELRAALIDAAIRHAAEHERTRDLLLGMVSHDLRGPLGAISMAAHVLGHGDHTPTVTATSARITRSTDRMARMVEQLLDYTRAKAGPLSVEPRPVELAALCREVANESAVGHPGATIEVDAPASCEVVCDADRIAQAIGNLLGNAFHHGDRDRPIALRLTADATTARVAVSNAGDPIPPDKLGSIFEPFLQARSHRPGGRQGGLGLGLYIVDQIARAHGGQVAVRSSAEAGTRVELILPRGGPTRSP